MKGKVYGHERIARIDKATGARVLQLTSYPTMSMGVGYAQSVFSTDSQRLIFLSQRMPQRDSPWDLFTVRSDGSGLTQLTDVDDMRCPNLSPKGDRAYYLRGSTLWGVDTETCEEEEVTCVEGGAPVWGSFLSPDGRHFLVSMNVSGTISVMKFDLRRGAAEAIADGWHALSMDAAGAGLLVADFQKKNKVYGFIGLDGELQGIYTRTHDFAHSTLLGSTRCIQGCALYPQRAILTLGLGEEVPRPLVEGPYFWHSSATPDGRWIVADTNWPNEGLKLVSVPDRSVRTLLHPGNSAGHPQWTHPHPCISPDGKLVLYNSDATGICQVYLARVPDDLLLPGDRSGTAETL